MQTLYIEDFTGEIYHAVDQFGNPINEITTVNGWIPFWREDPAEVILRPEMQIIDAVPPFLNPPRTNGVRGVKVFKLYARHDAGYYKQYTVPAGATILQVTAQGQHWYSQRDNAYLSEYQEDGVWHTIIDGEDGATVMVGIDPTGGVNPWAAGVVWSEANIYDGFAPVVLGLTSFGSLITVFIRSNQLYPFKHSDAYWASVEVAIDGEPEPPVDYVVVVELLPQDATMAEHNEVIERTFAQKRTHLQSADDAARLVAPGLPGSKVDVWAAARWPGDIEAYLRERGVEIIEFYEFEEDPDPPDPPDPITPVVPTGIIVGFGTVGDQGQSQNYEILASQGAAAPSAKFVVDLGAAALLKTKDPDVKVVGRKIDVMYNGQQYNVEWFKYELDPIEQANARMELLRATMMAYPAVDYWEIVNEQKPPTPPEIVKLCAFFKRAMTIAESWGKRLALFSFSTGTPEPESWDYALPTGVFQAALERRHVISLHEYGLWPRDADSHLLRFKALYSRLIPAGLGGIHLYITEYGVPREDWAVTDKMQQLREYDAQLARFPYVAGAHVYVNPWDPPYDQYTSIYPAYREYAVSTKDRING